jgi:[ribosomal protein S5]-alanine N-acetyltransferase
METNIKVSDELTLTAILPTDKANLIMYANDQAIYNNTLAMPFPYTEADADIFLQRVGTVEAKYGCIVYYAIRHIKGGFIGVIGRLMKDVFGGTHKDEIGYWIARPYWNRGYATQVVRVFTDACFADGKWRIEAHAFAPNIASQRVLEKAGFTREGVHQHNYFKQLDNTLHDTISYAKIKEDL